MKTRRPYTTALALLAATLLGSCGDEGKQLPDDGSEICLFTGLSAPENGISSGDLFAFAAGSSSGTYSEMWEARVAGGEAQLTPTRYYPADNSPVYLCGYYPPVAMGAAGIPFQLNGQQDVMVSGEQSGCLTDPLSKATKRFTFRHLLTQLNIRVRQTDGPPLRLKRLGIGGSRPAALLDLDKGRLAFNGSPAAFTAWQTAAEGTLVGTAWPDTLMNPVQAEPGVPLTLDVTLALADGTEQIWPALPIHFAETGGLSVAGIAYQLSVTLAATGTDPGSGLVTLTATVAEWQKGNEGSAIIDESPKDK